MESSKKNTLVFEFPEDAPGPTLLEMSRFVKNFGADHGAMDTCYRNADEKRLFIRFKTVEAFNDAIMENSEELIFRYSDGKTVHIKMSVAEGACKYVRIFNLPPEVEDTEISRVLMKYGKIKKLIREKFPPECELDLYTGIRGAYMEVQKPIPAALFIRNCKARIYYEGLKNRCFHCKADDHLKLNCPLLAEMRKEEESASRSLKQKPMSFAEVVSPKSFLAARLVAAQSSLGAVGTKSKSLPQESQETKHSGNPCSDQKEKPVDPFDGDSLDDDLFDDAENEQKEMEIDGKGLRTKRVLIGAPSQSDSEGSNAGSSIQRSVPKRQKNEQSTVAVNVGAGPLEAIQNIPKEIEQEEEDAENKQNRSVSQAKRNTSKRGKR